MTANPGTSVILTVATAGTGGGTVTSSPAGIDCAMGCSAPFELGQVVTLTASPAAGSLFDRWAGDAVCTDGSVTLNTDLQCVAVFRSVVPTNPVPFINTLSPLAVTPGAPDLLLSIEGANIHGDAVVRWNGVPYLPTVVTTTHLEARIPRSLLSSATTAVVTISNPPPGGGVSNEALIHIASPSSDFVFLTSTLGIGAEPSAVTAVDVNADGKPDLIVSKAASSALSVMLGNGDAAFGSRIDVSSGSGPSSVQAADLNHDNRMDLVTANSGSNTVSVFLGAGDGTFSSKTDSVTGTSPSALAVGDFNADGAIDLAVANSGSNTVSVLLGAGDGTFKTKIDYPTGNAPWAIVASDFNGDGSIDVITADRGSSTISLLPGIGDGTFASRSVVSAGSGPVGLAAGDFNGDGRLDLAVANENVNTVSVLLANGPGTFGQRSDLSVANAPRSIVVGDLNADGKLDIVVSNSGSNSVSLFLGAGDGTFGPRLDVAAGTTPTMLARADFDRDGRLDLAVVNEATNTLTILTGKSLAAAVSVSPSSLDFGRQVLGAPTVSRRVIVTNAGSAVLNVSSVMISGIPPSFEITTDGCTGSALPPRADCFVDVRYLAAAIGSTAASLEIRSDASGSPHTIMLAGEATAGPTAPPSLALPAQIVVEATSVLGATVSYVVSATSAAGDAVTVSCVPVSGTRFSIGSTLVSCSAADATGNVATGTFTVVVRDTTPPSVLITSPSPDVLISGSTVAVVVQASDVVGLASLSVNGIAATLSSGTPQVGTWRATVPVAVPVAPGNALRFDALALDAAGNAGTASRLVDNDGIPTALDHSRAEGADQSDRFSNDFNNGTTAGTLTRNGWGTKLSNTPTGTVVGPGGVRTTITGSGAGPAKVSACVGATKEVLLDVAGETADFACNPTTGTITVKALSAVAPAPGKVGTIELREQLSPNGPWQQFNLTTGSSMSVGSPATASASNTAPIVAELRQIAGTGRETVVGSYQLLPGASVDVSATAAGTGRGDLVRVNVLRGRVPITFGGVTRALRPGESATMPIDRRGPSVSCSAADQQWHAGNVNVACIGRENGASFAKSDDAMFSLTTTVEPGVETAAAVTSTREICDVGGGCAVAGPVGGNKVDLKAPTITIAVPAPDAVYVIDEVVAAAFECADGGSGVESCAGSAANGSPVQTSSVGACGERRSDRPHGHVHHQVMTARNRVQG
ncbi:MAG: hypothetical protein DMF95_10440 [Acidobacteria bacterium]|nr:MAG: hypothetical protein DMF95_10440 [Acidobacteriota bacterium]